MTHESRDPLEHAVHEALAQGEGPVATAICPSNIALVKYWGKRDPAAQWPMNDSLSMTLSEARTLTRARRSTDGSDHFWFAGADGPTATGAAPERALRHLGRLRELTGFTAPLVLTSCNTFPTASGIASSASGMSALTLAALGAWTGAADLDELELLGFPRQKVATLARLGSGSACRSLHGGFVQWEAGSEPSTQAVRHLAAAESFELADVIVLVSHEAKAVSSSEGHKAAGSSPLMAARLAGMPGRLERVRTALCERDLEALGVELEAEALEMHAVMMTSEPPARYLTPTTSAVLAWVRSQRTGRAARVEGARSGDDGAPAGIRAFFTLDAGPNVHLLCHPGDATALSAAVRQAFPGVSALVDRTGAGPLLTKESSP